jgi:hypothetical protein
VLKKYTNASYHNDWNKQLVDMIKNIHNKLIEIKSCEDYFVTPSAPVQERILFRVIDELIKSTGKDLKAAEKRLETLEPIGALDVAFQRLKKEWYITAIKVDGSEFLNYIGTTLYDDICKSDKQTKTDTFIQNFIIETIDVFVERIDKTGVPHTFTSQLNRMNDTQERTKRELNLKELETTTTKPFLQGLGECISKLSARASMIEMDMCQLAYQPYVFKWDTIRAKQTKGGTDTDVCITTEHIRKLSLIVSDAQEIYDQQHDTLPSSCVIHVRSALSDVTEFLEHCKAKDGAHVDVYNVWDRLVQVWYLEDIFKLN